MRKNIKHFHNHSMFFLLFFFSFFFPSISFNQAFADQKLPDDTLRFFSKNNILYYNPLGSLDCYSSSTSLVAGNTYEEKIWNYFVSAHIDGVSDNAMVIAGIMGNMKKESNYDPFCYSGNYIGLIMSSKPSFSPIKTKVSSSVGSNYWYDAVPLGYVCSKINDHPAGPTTTAITIELDALTKNEPKNAFYNSFQSFINHLGAPTNKTPSSYAELFEIEVERAVCNNNYPQKKCHSYSQPINDSGVLQRAKDYYGSSWPSSGYNYQGIAERREYAEEIYKKYYSSSPVSENPSNPETPQTEEGPSSTDDCFHSLTETFTHFDQKDSAYSGKYYDSLGINKYGTGSKNTISASACGPFSFAMLANALGVQGIDPLKVTEVAGNAGLHTDGSSHAITKVLSGHYGMTYEYVDTGHTDEEGKLGSSLSSEEKTKTIDKINSYLKKGWMIHTSGTSTSSSSPFTEGGHYIGIRGLTQDGKWLIADSNGDNGKKNSFKEWNSEDILSGMRVGNIHAIRASAAATCGNYTISSSCGNINSQGLVVGGMSLSQAQAYMDNYKKIAKNNSNKMLSDYKINRTGCTGGSFYNCVAFSQYFIAVNTSTGPFGGLPDGKNVVNTLINAGAATDGGHTPQPYAIFSRQSGGRGHGHTGVVLGVTSESIIVGEADCFGGDKAIKAKEIPLETATSNDYSYAYLNNLTIGK